MAHCQLLAIACVFFALIPNAFSVDAQRQSQKPLDLVYLSVRGTPKTFRRELLDHKLAENSPLKFFCDAPRSASTESDGALYIDANPKHFDYLIDILSGEAKTICLGSLKIALAVRHLATKWLPSMALNIDNFYLKCHKELKIEVASSNNVSHLQWRFDDMHTNYIRLTTHNGPNNIAQFCLDEWKYREHNLLHLLLPFTNQVVLYDLDYERTIGQNLPVTLNGNALTNIGGLKADITQVNKLINESVNNHICWYAGNQQFGIYNLRTGKQALLGKFFSKLADCQKELKDMVDLEE